MVVVGQFEFNQSSQQAFYFVQAVTNYTMQSEDIIVAYNGDVIVGAKQWAGAYTDVPVMGDEGEDYTEGYCTSGSIPTFKVWKAASNELVEMQVVGDTPAWHNMILPFISLEEVEDIEESGDDEIFGILVTLADGKTYALREQDVVLPE